MRIERIERFILPSGSVAGANLFVRITTEDGVSGLGQSGGWGYPTAVDAILAEFEGYLVGRDPARIEHHWHALHRMRPFRGNLVGAAVAAVDQALWDIAGKRYEAPVWQLLGGAYRDRVRLHLIVKATGPEELEQRAKDAVADGFTAVKFDPLTEGYQDLSAAELVLRVGSMCAAARSGAGAAVDLIVELHRKLDPATALGVLEATREWTPLYVEDPIPIDSIRDQGELARRAPVPIGAGERLSSVWEFRELLEAGGAQYLRPDIGIAGGLSHVRKIAALAEAFNAKIALHNFLGPVITAASVHLDVAIPNMTTLEVAMTARGDELVRTSVVREGGFIAAPQEPGLGVELDDAAIAALASTARERRSVEPVLRRDGSNAKSV